MQVFKNVVVILVITLVFSCVKRVETNTVYDNVYYQMDTVAVYQTAAQKVKQKTALQFLSILYADLFNKAIPSSELNDLDNLTLAFGDKGLITELYLTKYMQRGDVILPTNEEMRANTEAFIEDAFIRFYLRNPTAYEKRCKQNNGECCPLTRDCCLLADHYWAGRLQHPFHRERWVGLSVRCGQPRNSCSQKCV